MYDQLMGHIHDLYDFTVCAFVVFNSQVLLLHHKQRNKWLQPGGHIELNEDPEEALRRELKEEVGLALSDFIVVQRRDLRPKFDTQHKVLALPFDINVHQTSKNHRHIDLCYIVQSKTSKVRLEAAKAHDIGWFTQAEMKAKGGTGTMLPYTFELAKIALMQSS